MLMLTWAIANVENHILSKILRVKTRENIVFRGVTRLLDGRSKDRRFYIDDGQGPARLNEGPYR